MKKLFYLAIVLCAIACTNKKSSVNYAKFEPEDGKCLVFIGQDMEAIGGIEGKEGYINFFGTPVLHTKHLWKITKHKVLLPDIQFTFNI